MVAHPELPGSNDLDFDLNALKTGDLKVYPEQGRSPAPVERVDAGHLSRRHPREPQNVPARMTWDRGEAGVVLADISAGGAFVRVTAPNLPRRGESVRLWGFGKLAVLGEVAFVRPEEEAHLFATGAGVGVSFVVETDTQLSTEAPVCALFLKDWNTRRRALSAVDEARCLPFTADTLVELAVITLQLDVKLIVLDESIVERVRAALGLEERGIAVLAVRNPTDPIDASKVRARLPTPA